jgi:N-glycosylase/DNA lyase
MAATEIVLPVRDYDLAATLDSGQVFRWRQNGNFWEGVIDKQFVQLTQIENKIRAQTFSPLENWDFLRDFLQTETNLAAVLKTFPDDAPMNAAVASCRGLRLLRQDPWECLASFILSSTKQIVQIRQIIALLCEKFGGPCSVEPVARQNSATGRTLQFSFPTPQRIASAPRPNCAPAKWASARRTSSPPRDRLTAENLIWKNCEPCLTPKPNMN